MLHLFLNLYATSTINRKVYFEMGVREDKQTKPLGRIEFELFDDIVPETSENFYQMCVIKAYKNTMFHKINNDYGIEGGQNADIKNCSFEGLYGGNLKKEKFKVKHNEPLMLSTAKFSELDSTCFFINIIAKPSRLLRHVVFGKVIQGFEVFKEIEKLDWPLMSQHVVIVDCGEVQQENMLKL